MLACRVHERDVRKGKTTPYLGHLLAVSSLVMQFGGDEDCSIGALLHDAIEDHPETVSEAVLEADYGPRVARIVAFCTDTPLDYRGGPKPPWRPRKEAFLGRLARGTPDQKLVVCADKYSNVSELIADLRHDPTFSWSRFMAGETDQLWYYRMVATTLHGSGFRNPLLDEYHLQLGMLSEAVKARSAR